MRIATLEGRLPRVLLALAIVAGLLAVPAGATHASDDFEDVPDDHPFHDEISWMADEGITDGYENGTLFKPGRDVTRQAAAAFLFRLAGEPEGNYSHDFSDVPEDHPFHDAIAWASTWGIVNGYEDGTFRPARDVTRQAAAAFHYRLAGSPEVSGAPTFDDVGSDHPFADAIAWVDDQGIAEGYSDGTYKPGRDVTRQAAAAFLFRLDDVTGTISGMVNEEEEGLLGPQAGDPIEGAWVWIDETTHEYVTAADGAYALGFVPAGEYTVWAWAEGYGHESQTVTVEAGTDVADVDFLLAPPEPGVIEGTVTDADSGDAIEGATVTVEGQGESQETTTDASGDYQFTEVPSGEHTVAADASGYAAEEQDVFLESGGTEQADFALQPQAYDVVFAANGATLDGASAEQEQTLTNGTLAVQEVPADSPSLELELHMDSPFSDGFQRGDEACEGLLTADSCDVIFDALVANNPFESDTVFFEGQDLQLAPAAETGEWHFRWDILEEGGGLVDSHTFTLTVTPGPLNGDIVFTSNGEDLDGQSFSPGSALTDADDIEDARLAVENLRNPNDLTLSAQLFVRHEDDNRWRAADDCSRIDWRLFDDAACTTISNALDTTLQADGTHELFAGETLGLHEDVEEGEWNLRVRVVDSNGTQRFSRTLTISITPFA